MLMWSGRWICKSSPERFSYTIPYSQKEEVLSLALCGKVVKKHRFLSDLNFAFWETVSQWKSEDHDSSCKY